MSAIDLRQRVRTSEDELMRGYAGGQVTLAWFLVRIGIRTSQFAHLFATHWHDRHDGEAIAACGVSPYEQRPDEGTEVRFLAAGEDVARCTACRRLEGP